MKKKGRSATKKKPSAADFLVSPEQPQVNTTNNITNRSSESPKSFEFHLNLPAKTTAGKSRRKTAQYPVNSPKLRRPEVLSSSSSISELKEVVSSRLDSIKRQVDKSYLDLAKEVEFSQSYLHKRTKIQTQACQELMDVTEKEFKKITEKITESCEAMKVSYAEFIVEAPTTVSRVRRTSIPEKEQSFEKRFDALRSRCGILSTPD